jgi:hypothetical protein
VAVRHAEAKAERVELSHAERVAAAKAERAAMMAELDAMAAKRAAERAKVKDADIERATAEAMAKRAARAAEATRAAKAVAKAAPSAAALRAKAVAERAAELANAKAAKVAAEAAKRTAKRAKRAAELAEWRAEFDALVFAEARAEAKRVAALDAEAAKADKAMGGMWAANIGGLGSKFGESLRPIGFTAEARGRMAADADMMAAAEAIGVTAAEAATMWSNEKADMRQARAERTAAMYVARRADAKTRAEVMEYRNSAGYVLGGRVLAMLGRDVMAVVSTNAWDSAAEAEAVIYSAERVDAEAVSKAVAKYATAAKAMAEAEAVGDSKARAKAVAAFKRAEAKAAEATAEAARWAARPLADGVACLFVAKATHRTTAAELAKMAAKVAARWDNVTAERGGRVAAETRRVVGGAAADTTAKRAMSGAERVAKHRAEKRAAEGKAPARDYNSAALHGRNRGRAKNALSEAKRVANACAKLA